MAQSPSSLLPLLRHINLSRGFLPLNGAAGPPPRQNPAAVARDVYGLTTASSAPSRCILGAGAGARPQCLLGGGGGRSVAKAALRLRRARARTGPAFARRPMRGRGGGRGRGPAAGCLDSNARRAAQGRRRKRSGRRGGAAP